MEIVNEDKIPDYAEIEERSDSEGEIYFLVSVVITPFRSSDLSSFYLMCKYCIGNLMKSNIILRRLNFYEGQRPVQQEGGEVVVVLMLSFMRPPPG